MKTGQALCQPAPMAPTGGCSPQPRAIAPDAPWGLPNHSGPALASGTDPAPPTFPRASLELNLAWGDCAHVNAVVTW